MMQDIAPDSRRKRPLARREPAALAREVKLLAKPIVAVANSMAAYLSREGRTLVPTEPADGGTPAPTG